MDKSLEDLKASIDAYIANVNKLIEQRNADVAKIVADAVAADDAGEAVELAELKRKIEEANSLVVPPFSPSNN